MNKEPEEGKEKVSMGQTLVVLYIEELICQAMKSIVAHMYYFVLPPISSFWLEVKVSG